MFDWGASHLGLYESSNNIRFITGFLAGSSIMSIVFPVFNYQYYKQSSNARIFKSPKQLIVYFLIIAIFIAATLLRFSFLSLFYYYLSALSVFFTFFFINLLMLLLIPVFANRAHRLISRFLILPSIISLVLTFLELFISYKLHEFLLNLSI
jgi:Ni/Fe-hydrogenase subunit HybB-like protein